MNPDLEIDGHIKTALSARIMIDQRTVWIEKMEQGHPALRNEPPGSPPHLTQKERQNIATWKGEIAHMRNIALERCREHTRTLSPQDRQKALAASENILNHKSPEYDVSELRRHRMHSKEAKEILQEATQRQRMDEQRTSGRQQDTNVSPEPVDKMSRETPETGAHQSRFYNPSPDKDRQEKTKRDTPSEQNKSQPETPAPSSAAAQKGKATRDFSKAVRQPLPPAAQQRQMSAVQRSFNTRATPVKDRSRER